MPVGVKFNAEGGNSSYYG